MQGLWLKFRHGSEFMLGLGFWRGLEFGHGLKIRRGLGFWPGLGSMSGLWYRRGLGFKTKLGFYVCVTIYRGPLKPIHLP